MSNNEKHRKSRSEITSETGNEAHSKPRVLVSTNEHETNDATVAALANDSELFQRGGAIVRVLNGESEDSNKIRRPAGPRIEPVAPASLREALTRNTEYFQQKVVKGSLVDVPAHPPAWCVSAVYNRSEWAPLRHLDAVIEYPVITPAGEIHSTPGYDERTGLFLAPSGRVNPVTNNPSSDDVNAAIDSIDDVISDFPFQHPEHRGAFFAALLTPLARFAFPGPTPLFLMDANVRGAGKSLLADVIGRIITGRPMVVSTFTNDADELRKRITSLAMAGDRLVLLDNLSGFVRSAILDAALTSEWWDDRLLGLNKTVKVPLLMVWYATGNNCELFTDTARRTCPIRLESDQENPERRGDFKYSNLTAVVTERRPELLAAALTLLRAYYAAGRPDLNLPNWGSFPGWSNIVRNAVVWLGLGDPGETRLKINDNDPTTEALGLLMSAWEQADAGCRGLTASEFIDRVKTDSSCSSWIADGRTALDFLTNRMDARSLGNRLRGCRRRIINGCYFDRAGEHKNSIRWAVFPADQFSLGRIETHQTHQTHPGPGESDESGESVSLPENSDDGYVAQDLDENDRAVLDMFDRESHSDGWL